MKNLFLRVRTAALRLPVEIYIMAAVAALMLWQFGGAWSSSLMSSGDWPGHQQAALEMRACLRLGTWDCLVEGQFGGLPLFQMYAPLFFVVTGLISLLLSDSVSLFLIMRALVFMGVLATAPALWYFTRAFLGRPAARWAMALSTIFIFYPYALGCFGLGAGGSFLVGLVPAAFGIPLVFFWLGALKEMTDEPKVGRAWWLALGLGTALALTHTMSLIFGSVLAGLLFLYRGADRGVLRRFIGVGAATLGLAAFWIVPFAAYSKLSPGASIPDIPIIWWEAILPARVTMGWPLALVIAALTVTGFYVAVRRAAWAFVMVYGGAWLFFFTRIFLNKTWPDLVIHYYRFLAFLAMLGLAAGGLALAWAWQAASSARRRNGWYVVSVAAIVMLMSAFLLNGDYRDSSGNDRVLDEKVIWEPRELPGAAAVKELVDVMSREGGAGRVAVEAPGIMGSFVYGSEHYLPAVLQYEIGMPMSNGLYGEAGTLTSFYLSAQNELTAGHLGLRAKEFIRTLKAYRSQPTVTNLNRLADLGVTHQVFISPEKAELVRATGIEDEVASTPDFAVFRARKSRPIVSAADHKPLVFAASYGELKFHDLAMALFAGERTYDALVVVEERPVGEWAAQAKERFSGVIVDAAYLDDETLGELKALGLPVIALNHRTTEDDGLESVPAFEPLDENTYMGERAWPDGWQQLWEAVARVRDGNRLDGVDAPKLVTDDRRRVEFTTAGRGPVVINYAYFPSWHVTGGADRAYRVTPDRLLVYPDGTGKVSLRYGGSGLQRASLAVTAGTVVALAGLAWHLRRRSSRADS